MKLICGSLKFNILIFISFESILENTVDSRYLEFDYLEELLIARRTSGPCLNIEI